MTARRPRPADSGTADLDMAAAQRVVDRALSGRRAVDLTDAEVARLQDAALTAAKRGRGRPPVGAPTNLRLTPELRERLDAARRPGEGVAEAARRLLAVALDPVVPAALALAAAAWDDASSADCPVCAAAPAADLLCSEHADYQDRADACRALAAELAAAPEGDPR